MVGGRYSIFYYKKYPLGYILSSDVEKIMIMIVNVSSCIPIHYCFLSCDTAHKLVPLYNAKCSKRLDDVSSAIVATVVSSLPRRTSHFQVSHRRILISRTVNTFFINIENTA